MRRLLGVGTLVVLVATATVLVGVTPVALGDTGDPTVTSSNTPESPAGLEQFDRTQFQIQVHANGSARFTVRHERRLTNDSERQQFRAFADDFESNETELYSDFTRRARELAAFGRNETGRNMSAVDFRRGTGIEPSFNEDVGVVTMSFRWTAFAKTAEDQVVVDDVFEGGFYIGPSQSLVFVPGDGLVFEEVAPTGEYSAPTPAESDSVTWQGERSFSDQRPRVALVPEGGAGNATTTSDGDRSDGGQNGTSGTDVSDGTDRPSGQETTPNGDQAGGDSIPMLPIMALLVLVGIAGAVVWWRSRDDGAAPIGGPGTAAAGTGETTAGDTATAVTAAEPTVPDEELLTDEDRVVDLLNENGGRMRQSNIVETTDWSKSKVSMLLSDMEDEGTISKLRVGRENIVSLAGHEPDAAGSPFEDEEGVSDSEDGNAMDGK